MLRLLVPLLLPLAATPALAGDGVLEINQTCAVATGCFPGDAPGFPITIDGTAGKSYRFTSDVGGLATADAGGLVLGSSRLSIDLAGFSLNGPSIGSAPGNAISGTGVGGAAAQFATIRGGTIRGWKQNAITLPAAVGVRVEDLVLDFNAGDSIEVGKDAQIRRNRIASASLTTTRLGILAGDRASIVGNHVTGMGLGGIECGEGCEIVDNLVSDSGGRGIKTSLHSLVTGNRVFANRTDGIVAINSTVSRNVSTDNGDRGIINDGTIADNRVASNGSHGILITFNTSVHGNVVVGNEGDGIRAGQKSSVRRNIVTANEEDGIRVTEDSVVEDNVVSHGNGCCALSLGDGSLFRDNTLTTFVTPCATGGKDAGGNTCNGAGPSAYP